MLKLHYRNPGFFKTYSNRVRRDSEYEYTRINPNGKVLITPCGFDLADKINIRYLASSVFEPRKPDLGSQIWIVSWMFSCFKIIKYNHTVLT